MSNQKPRKLLRAFGLVVLLSSLAWPHAIAANEAAPGSRLQQIPFRRGETAVVSTDGAEFVDTNHRLIARLPEGTHFDVASAAVAWVGGYVELDGRRRMGWIHAKDLAALPPRSQGPPQSPP